VDSAAGRVTLDGRLDGTVGDTRLLGELTLREVAARLPGLGILIEDLTFDARGDLAGSIALNGRLRSGGGELTLSGTTPALPSIQSPGLLRIEGNRVEIADNALLHAVVSPRLEVRFAADTLDVRGQVDVPLARLVLTRIPESAVSPSDDVVLLDSLEVERRPIAAELRISLGDSVSFSGFNFDAELGGSMLVRQRPGQLPTANGTLVIEEGSYEAYGQDLHIRNGEVRFAGGSVDDPGLSIRATRTAQDSVVVGIAITGTLREPQARLFSESGPMAETQILSYLLTGRPAGEGTSSGNFVSKALTSLGLKGGNLLATSVGEHIGLEDARLSTEGDVRETALLIGRFLTPSLYVSYGIGIFDPVSTLRLRYMLSNRFTILAETGGRTSVDALIRLEP
jgi:translocation and assembly module TamB